MVALDFTKLYLCLQLHGVSHYVTSVSKGYLLGYYIEIMINIKINISEFNHFLLYLHSLATSQTSLVLILNGKNYLVEVQKSYRHRIQKQTIENYRDVTLNFFSFCI